ncbi:hypothetical protein B0I33_111209 [Prauserella shujinwangii]|uniref:Uncharacterized protein n=1 Tax=Prauserella shujinwangii TaxID=1453103 RepID=A0A2T0LND0_9PSEU|nr:hypothetical protein [Prauserella shujinwangii]PRX44695.1 hypothetical protein B0I33_111209 [Prauserella shujinwangii]
MNVRQNFAFQSRFQLPLALLGVREDTAFAEIGEAGLRVRFGPWAISTPARNLAGAEVTGPYSAIKAIGVRLSLRDRGLTFGTSTARGVCVRFREPVRGSEPLGLLRHPGLTLTLERPDEFAQHVQSTIARP